MPDGEGFIPEGAAAGAEEGMSAAMKAQYGMKLVKKAEETLAVQSEKTAESTKKAATSLKELGLRAAETGFEIEGLIRLINEVDRVIPDKQVAAFNKSLRDWRNATGDLSGSLGRLTDRLTRLRKGTFYTHQEVVSLSSAISQMTPMLMASAQMSDDFANVLINRLGLGAEQATKGLSGILQTAPELAAAFAEGRFESEAFFIAMQAGGTESVVQLKALIDVMREGSKETFATERMSRTLGDVWEEWLPILSWLGPGLAFIGVGIGGIRLATGTLIPAVKSMGEAFALAIQVLRQYVTASQQAGAQSQVTASQMQTAATQVAASAQTQAGANQIMVMGPGGQSRVLGASYQGPRGTLGTPGPGWGVNKYLSGRDWHRPAKDFWKPLTGSFVKLDSGMSRLGKVMHGTGQVFWKGTATLGAAMLGKDIGGSLARSMFGAQPGGEGERIGGLVGGAGGGAIAGFAVAGPVGALVGVTVGALSSLVSAITNHSKMIEEVTREGQRDITRNISRFWQGGVQEAARRPDQMMANLPREWRAATAQALALEEADDQAEALLATVVGVNRVLDISVATLQKRAQVTKSELQLAETRGAAIEVQNAAFVATLVADEKALEAERESLKLREQMAKELSAELAKTTDKTKREEINKQLGQTNLGVAQKRVELQEKENQLAGRRVLLEDELWKRRQKILDHSLTMVSNTKDILSSMREIAPIESMRLTVRESEINYEKYLEELRLARSARQQQDYQREREHLEASSAALAKSFKSIDVMRRGWLETFTKISIGMPQLSRTLEMRGQTWLKGPAYVGFHEMRGGGAGTWQQIVGDQVNNMRTHLADKLSDLISATHESVGVQKDIADGVGRMSGYGKG